MQIHAVIEGKTNAHDAPFFAFDGDLLTGYNIAHASVIAEAWNFVHKNLTNIYSPSLALRRRASCISALPGHFFVMLW